MTQHGKSRTPSNSEFSSYMLYNHIHYARGAEQCTGHRNAASNRLQKGHGCDKPSHTVAACRLKSSTLPHRQQDNKTTPQMQRPKVQYWHNNNPDHVFQCTGSSTPPMRVELTVNCASLCMEVDTGPSASIISENTYRSIWSAAK